MGALRPLSRYFEFTGRSGRAEFWQFMGLYWVVLIAVLLVENAVGDEFGVVSTLMALATFVPQISLSVRRFHDTGHSGWMIVLVYAVMVLGVFFGVVAGEQGRNSKGFFLAAAALIYYCYLMAKRGDEGDNEYGSPDDAETIEHSAPRYPMTEPAPAWTPPAPTSSTDDTMARIERLGALRERGLLSEEEFLTQKAAILAQG